MNERRRAGLALSPLWLQGVVLTFVVGFAILGYLAIPFSTTTCAIA